MPFWNRHREPSGDADLNLVVGLGNPGSRFERTRHNIGFMVAGELALRASATFRSSKQRAEVARGAVEGLNLLVARPQTFMNLSGIAVSRLLSYYHLPVNRLIVVCDDLDLPFGTLRLRPSGSSGGNRGLMSIISELGTEDFTRLRVGVGRPRGEAIDHVLSRFPPEHEELLPGLVSIAADAVLAALQDVRTAMNEFNRDWLPSLVKSGSGA